MIIQFDVDFDYPCRITSNDAPIRDIFRNHSISPNYHMIPDLDSRINDSSPTYVDMMPQICIHILMCFITIVVVS